MIELACEGMGCNENVLVELFVTRPNAELDAGRAAWEGKHDASLVDYLDGELGYSYRHLKALLLHLLKGSRDEGDAIDEAEAAHQVKKMHKECHKGMLGDFDEEAFIGFLGSNNPTMSAHVARLYEVTRWVGGGAVVRCDRERERAPLPLPRVAPRNESPLSTTPPATIGWFPPLRTSTASRSRARSSRGAERSSRWRSRRCSCPRPSSSRRGSRRR